MSLIFLLNGTDIFKKLKYFLKLSTSPLAQRFYPESCLTGGRRSSIPGRNYPPSHSEVFVVLSKTRVKTG